MLRPLLVSLSMLIVLGCSGTPRPCERGDAPAGCDAPCSASSACRAGLYCENGRCTADCTSDADCGGGTCSPDGRCESAMDGSVAARDATSSADAMRHDANCASVAVGANRTTPNVVLVIDRSGSMDWDFDGDSRWDTLEDALLSTDGPISSLESNVRFGVAMYTSEGSSCPDLVTIPAALDNYGAIEDGYREEGPGGGTPTGDSITEILSRIDTLAPERADPTVLVLATDGEPDTCEDENDKRGGREESVDAVEAAYSMGIRTFVLSVGVDIAQEHLQDVANAGVGRGDGDPDAEFWVATDTSGLTTALQEIIGGVVSCNVELEGRIDPDQACSGTVRLGTEELECGTDWRAVDETHIEILGDACARLQTSDEELTASFPCGVILI